MRIATGLRSSESRWRPLLDVDGRLHPLQPIAADIEPGEDGAVQQVEGERASLETQDAAAIQTTSRRGSVPQRAENS